MRYHVTTSVNSVIINRNQRDKLGSAFSCDLNSHLNRSEADNRLVTTGNLKGILPCLHTDYILLINKHNYSHKQTLHRPFSSRTPN